MNDSAKHIFVIAGEESGDLLGGRLIQSLKTIDSALRFSGIGGESMKRHGIQSLFPMEDLSVMGVAEVLPKLPLLLGRIDETVKHILRTQPDMVITIDAPDFSFRVMKRLRRKGFKGRLVHYVAPSVWAWRPKRARKIAEFLDRVLCLLPFEPPYFEKEGLAADFVGHSMTEDALRGDEQHLREMFDISTDQRVVLLLPGSRGGEIKKHLDLFARTAESLSAMYENLIFVIPTLPNLKEGIEAGASGFGCDIIVTDNPSAKKNAFAAAELALAASGTVALELALANVPSVIAYRMNTITGWIAKWLVKTDYVSLPNIILQEEVMPEFLLGDAKLENLVNVMDCYLSNPTFTEMQKQKFQKLMQHITPSGGLKPSEKAAKVVYKELFDV